MSERVRAFAPDEVVAISLRLEYEGDGEIEPGEAVFVREGSSEVLVFLGDARENATKDRATSYASRLEARVGPNANPREYRCARLSARDRLDDGWELSDIGKLNLTVRVERAPRWLEVTISEFL